MRTILLGIILISSVVVKAQIGSPLGFMNYMQLGNFTNNPLSVAGTSDKKWFVSSYTCISTSFNFFNGGSATVVSAPLGLQLNRKLNNNLYAFAGVSVAPAYINFSRSLLSADFNKANSGNGLFKPNSFGMYSRAELGLMYVNDAKTFSISGSVGVERSSYPMLPYQQMNRSAQNTNRPLNK